MATRDEMIAEINRLEELKAVEAELAKRQKPLGERAVEGLSSVGSSLAQAGKTIWDNLARGAGNAVSSATTQSIERDVPGLVPPSPKQQFSNWVAEDVKAKLPIPENESFGGKLVRKGTEAIGSGLVMGTPGMAKAPIASIAALFAGGAGGEAGGTAGRKLGGPGPMGDAAEAVGSIGGSLLGSGVAGMALGPSLSAGEQAVRRNTRELSKQDFAAADNNLSLFNQAGAKTATLPEAFEGRTSLLGLAENTRASKGGEVLAARTANRAGDLQDLGNEFLNRVGPAKDPNAVAGEAVGKANLFKGTLEKMRSSEFGRALDGQSITPAQGFSTYRRLVAEAKAHPDPDYREALVDVAKRFLDEHKKNAPITDVQTLSFRLKRLKDAEASPTAATGTVINKMDTKKAVAYAEELLGQINPKFAEANKRFELDSANIDKQMSGGFGRLADKNPVTAAEPTVNKLNPLFASGDGNAIAQALGQLQTPGPTFGPAVKGNDVLRAWASQKLDKGSTDPGGTIRGLEGSSAEARIAAALTASGKNPSNTLAPLNAADKLQNFSGLPGMKEPPELSGASAFIRPHRAADFMMTDASRTKMHEEIAQLMMPTRENLKKLIELSKFDPNVRRMLIARGVIAPQLSDKD